MRKDSNHWAEWEQNDIVRAFKANDALVLRRTYKDNFGMVKVFVIQNKGNEDSAKHVFQDAFITLWENIRSGQFVPGDRSALKRYLFTIATNKWKDYLRLAQYENLNSGTQSEGINIKGLTMDERLIYDVENDRMNRLMEAFKQLNKTCRDLLRKAYFEKTSISDIALDLELDAPTGRVKKYSCMQKLRELARN